MVAGAVSVAVYFEGQVSDIVVEVLGCIAVGESWLVDGFECAVVVVFVEDIYAVGIVERWSLPER